MKINRYYILFLLVFLSFFSSIFCLSFFKNINLKYIYIFPLAFSIGLLIFHKMLINYFKSIVFTVVISEYFFKLVIIPIFLVIGNNYSLLRNVEVYKNMNFGILLTSYEWFCISFFLYILSKKKVSIITEEKIKLNSKIKIIVFLLLTIVIIIAFFNSEVLGFSFSIFDFDNTRHLKIRKMQENVSKINYIIYIYCFEYLKYLLPVYVLGSLEKTKSKILKILIVILDIILILILSGSTLAETIIVLIVFVILVVNIYFFKYKKIIYTSIFSVIGILSILLLGIKSITIMQINNLTIFDYMSAILQGYFSGPINVATALSIKKEINGIILMLIDFVKGIIILNPFFKDFSSSIELFNQTFYNSTRIKDQIIPMIGQLYLYFGFLLSPCLLFFIIKLSIFFENQSKNSADLFSKFMFIYLSVFLSMSIIMYNLSIVVSKLFMLSIFIIIYLIENNIRRKKNVKRIKNLT